VAGAVVGDGEAVGFAIYGQEEVAVAFGELGEWGGIFFVWHDECSTDMFVIFDQAHDGDFNIALLQYRTERIHLGFASVYYY